MRQVRLHEGMWNMLQGKIYLILEYVLLIPQSNLLNYVADVGVTWVKQCL